MRPQKILTVNIQDSVKNTHPQYFNSIQPWSYRFV